MIVSTNYFLKQEYLVFLSYIASYLAKILAVCDTLQAGTCSGRNSPRQKERVEVEYLISNCGKWLTDRISIIHTLFLSLFGEKSLAANSSEHKPLEASKT